MTEAGGTRKAWTRSIVATVFLLPNLGQISLAAPALPEPSTVANVCLQRYLTGAAPRQSAVPLQSLELRRQLTGDDPLSVVGRGAVLGLAGLEAATLYPPQKLVKKYMQHKDRRVSRLIYDAFDNVGDLPDTGTGLKLTAEELRGTLPDGEAVNWLAQKTRPYAAVHGIRDKDQLKALIRRSSASGALCPLGATPSLEMVAALINSGLLPKMADKGEQEPGFWLAKDEGLPPAEAADAGAEGDGRELSQTDAVPPKAPVSPLAKAQRRLARSLFFKAFHLQAKFRTGLAFGKRAGYEEAVWKAYRPILARIEQGR